MTEDTPKAGTLVMAVGAVAGANMIGKELRLASIAGAEDMVYKWPLTVGKGVNKKLLKCGTVSCNCHILITFD